MFLEPADKRFSRYRPLSKGAWQGGDENANREAIPCENFSISIYSKVSEKRVPVVGETCGKDIRDQHHK
jgi:hypothetical protein